MVLPDVLLPGPAPQLGLGVVLLQVVQENNEVLQDHLVVVVNGLHGRSSVCGVPISPGGNINKSKKRKNFLFLLTESEATAGSGRYHRRRM